MSLESCWKEILCLEKAKAELESLLGYIDFNLNRAKENFGELGDKEIEKMIEKSEIIIKGMQLITSKVIE